jgi:hypothetical protein
MSEIGNPEPSVNIAPAPLSPERLPPQARKHADAKAPVPLRMMGAKGLVPLTPIDTTYLLALLATDPDPQVSSTAVATAAKLPDKILSTALREDSQDARVLDFFANALVDREPFLELVLLNNATPDETVARLAATVPVRLAEIIGQNQLRLLRDDRILRALCGNPNAPAALIDGMCDFAVRSGLTMDDLEPMRAARIRVFGANPVPGPSPAEQEALEQEVVAAVAEAQEADENDAEAKARPVGAWSKMNVAQKIRAASFKDSAFRVMALKDSNKLVAMAAIHSPRITDGEIELVARSPAVNEDVLRVLYNNREWTKSYGVKLSLVKNPKVPLPVANRFLVLLRETDLKMVVGNRNVPAGVRNQAKAMLSARQKPGSGH